MYVLINTQLMSQYQSLKTITWGLYKKNPVRVGATVFLTHNQLSVLVKMLKPMWHYCKKTTIVYGQEIYCGLALAESWKEFIWKGLWHVPLQALVNLISTYCKPGPLWPWELSIVIFTYLPIWFILNPEVGISAQLRSWGFGKLSTRTCFQSPASMSVAV